MAGPLSAAGATPEPSEYACLSQDRLFTGQWTQRSPFRDADVPYIYGKFYQAGRFDSLIDGLNRELNPRLTLARRPGTQPLTSVESYGPVNSFYPFKFIQELQEVIRLIVDDQDGSIYDATDPSTKVTLFTKTTAAKTRFLGVGTTLYFTDGVDLKKMLRSSLVWAATTAFTAGQFIIDPNLNVQVCTTPGTTGGTQPTWATSSGATTNDGSVVWTCKGAAVQNWGIVGPQTAPGVANAQQSLQFPTWAANTFYIFSDLLLDSNGNLQLLYTSGTTGTTPPTWSATPGALTTDGTAHWLCVQVGATRLTNHAYHVAVDTTLQGSISSGTQIATPGSMAGIYVGKVLVIDTGSPREAVVVSAVTSTTFTATFANGHAAAAPIVAPADTIAVDFHITVKLPKGNQLVYFTDFFACTTAGTSSSSATSTISWTPGAGGQNIDGTVTWTNTGKQLVWNNPITNPDGTITQTQLNPTGAAVPVSNVTQIDDSNGNLQNLSLPGLSGSTAPTWNTNLNGLTHDNQITWTNVGPAPTTANTQPWGYGYSYEDSVDVSESTGSPLSYITLNDDSFIVVQGQGSADPQVDTINIYRTALGQATPLLLASIPNPGAGEIWTYTDPATPDTSLNALIVMPQFGANNPPQAGTTAPCWHCGRVFAILGNLIVYSDGPDTNTNGNTAFNPLNFIPLPEQGIRLFSGVTNQGLTLFAWGTSNVYAVFGLGTESSPFQPATTYMSGVGILSYDAVTLVGGTFYAYTSKNKVVMLDPSAGYIEAGFPIEDQFTYLTVGGGTGQSFNPANSYVTWHEESGRLGLPGIFSTETALFVSDGSGAYFKFAPVAAPESGFVWSPIARIVGGFSAVQSIEIAPGQNLLLFGPATGTTDAIKFRDYTNFTDYTGGEHVPYPSWAVLGNIVLCQSGEVAEIAHIALKSAAVGTRPSVSLLIGEISPTTQVPWDTLEITSTDPPDLEPSQTVFSDRYSALQSGVTPKCDNFQLKMDYGAQVVQDETLMFSIYGAKHAERREQL